MSQPDKSYTVAFTRAEIEALVEALGEPFGEELIFARSKLLDAQEEPLIPVGVRLRVRDGFGRESVYAHRWEAVQRETAPGQKGMWIVTGITDPDVDGVRAECEVHIGIYSPDGPPRFE
jgi:hypothetical protein